MIKTLGSYIKIYINNIKIKNLNFKNYLLISEIVNILFTKIKIKDLIQHGPFNNNLKKYIKIFMIKAIKLLC